MRFFGKWFSRMNRFISNEIGSIYIYLKIEKLLTRLRLNHPQRGAGPQVSPGLSGCRCVTMCCRRRGVLEENFR